MASSVSKDDEESLGAGADLVPTTTAAPPTFQERLVSVNHGFPAVLAGTMPFWYRCAGAGSMKISLGDQPAASSKVRMRWLGRERSSGLFTVSTLTQPCGAFGFLTSHQGLT